MKNTGCRSSVAPLALAFLAALVTASSARAGLRFQQVPTLPGATATALASDGTSVWAGTPRGVWKLAAGAWAPDGLSGHPVASLAVVGSDVYAADGTNVYRRASTCLPVPGGPCVQEWDPEPLSGSVTQPGALATDGASLWAAGAGVAKKSGGTWTALASPGGTAFSAAVWNGDLVAGLRGNVARYAGSSVSYFSAGMPVTANVQALASVSGVLWAGTDQTLYSWNGAMWVAETGFGFHDVRAITGAGGILRAATADAGILKKSGSWGPDSGGVLAPGALSFATAGSDLYAGTAGAPVVPPLGVVVDRSGHGPLGGEHLGRGQRLRVGRFVDGRVGARRGARARHGNVRRRGRARLRGRQRPRVRGNRARPVRVATRLSSSPRRTATSRPTRSRAASSPLRRPRFRGLPTGILPTTLARVSDGNVAGGTPSAGMWRFVGLVVVRRQRRPLGHGVDPRDPRRGRDAVRIDRHGPLRARAERVDVRARSAGPRAGSRRRLDDALRGARDGDLGRDARRRASRRVAERRLRHEHGVRLVARHRRRS